MSTVTLVALTIFQIPDIDLIFGILGDLDQLWNWREKVTGPTSHIRFCTKYLQGVFMDRWKKGNVVCTAEYLKFPFLRSTHKPILLVPWVISSCTRSQKSACCVQITVTSLHKIHICAACRGQTLCSTGSRACNKWSRSIRYERVLGLSFENPYEPHASPEEKQEASYHM